MSSTHDVDWLRGVTYSVAASIIGGASKLSIRKSWLILADLQRNEASDCVNFSFDTNNLIAKEEYLPSRNYTTVAERDESLTSTEVSTSISIFKIDSVPIIAHLYKKYQHNRKVMSWALYFGGMIGMLFLNPICCILAMKYVNPSILAPFSGLTLVWVVLFSRYFTGECSSVRQRMACGLIILGQVMVAVFGDHTNTSNLTVEAVACIIFMILVFILFCFIIQMSPEKSIMRKISWGSLGGSITGFQNFLKDALTLLNATQKSNDISSLPAIFYLFVFLAILTAFIGLLCLSACMKRFDATYSAAMFVVSFVLSASLISCVHYHTFQNLEGTFSFIFYPMGLLQLFCGALMLVKNDGVSDAYSGNTSTVT